MTFRLESRTDHLTSRTVRPWVPLVNTLLPVETRGVRLRRYLMTQTGAPHGWVNSLAKESGVKRQTLSAWMGDRATPDLLSIEAIARALGVRPYEVLAAMDGEGPVVRVDDQLREVLREEIESAIDERLGPRREARGRADA